MEYIGIHLNSTEFHSLDEKVRALSRKEPRKSLMVRFAYHDCGAAVYSDDDDALDYLEPTPTSPRGRGLR